MGHPSVVGLAAQYSSTVWHVAHARHDAVSASQHMAMQGAGDAAVGDAVVGAAVATHTTPGSHSFDQGHKMPNQSSKMPKRESGSASSQLNPSPHAQWLPYTQ